MADLSLEEASKRRRIIAYWLFVVAFMVFAMVILGGVTRLTHSGLSMVDWKPLTRWLPPATQAQWQHLFDLYRESPEFRKINFDMDVEGFKGIFWLEFLHRVWGRVIGVFFFLPAIFFIASRWVDRPLGWKLAGMFVLGGLQGVLGWYMVKSGLIDRPDVSQYRLVAHFGAALVILAFMLWVAMDLLWPKRHPIDENGKAPPWRFAVGLAALVFLTALSGAFVAGLDAGLAYNTFPLMDGSFIPQGAFASNPFWLSFFEDMTTVQFNHRILAEAAFLLILFFWFKTRGANIQPRARLAAGMMALTALVQVILGISTLLLAVPTSLAAAHQAGATVLFACALWTAHAMRPRPLNTRLLTQINVPRPAP